MNFTQKFNLHESLEIPKQLGSHSTSKENLACSLITLSKDENEKITKSMGKDSIIHDFNVEKNKDKK